MHGQVQFQAYSTLKQINLYKCTLTPNMQFQGYAFIEIQSALVIRTTFVPLCFSEKNVLVTSRSYECSYNQRNYLVFWKSILATDVFITRFLYNVLITRVDCISVYAFGK